MVGLQSLAFELLHEIVWLLSDSPPPSRSLTYYEVKALGVVRSICRFANAVAEGILFRHLVMRINFADPNSLCHSQLRDLTQGKTAACAHAKALTLYIYGGRSDGSSVVGNGELALALDTLRNVTSVM
jgi:hypothetical protein